VGYSMAPKHSFDLYPSMNGDALCTSIIADIRDRKKLEEAIVEHQPDFLFHFAAQALVIDSYDDPIGTYETNVMGTVNVLNALRQLGKPCYSVLVTTDKVYHNNESGEAYPEDAKLGGYDPYSSSKACAEIAINSLRSSFLHPNNYAKHQQAIASVRSGNVIGGGDWSANRLVPDIARSLSKDEAVVIRNPNSTRPWQHVLDPLNGYLYLAAKLVEDPVRFSDAFNFGPEVEDERTVEELAQLAIEVWGKGSYEVPTNLNQPHEAGKLNLSIEKAKSILGWKPGFTSAEAVCWTMEWYKHAGDDPKGYTLQQIQAFLERS